MLGAGRGLGGPPISIDDNEQAYMRILCDELFGRDKFIAQVVWQKRYSRENREAIGDVHEYVIVYARNREHFKKIHNPVPDRRAHV